MRNTWIDIRDNALRPIYPAWLIEQHLTEQALLLTAGRIAERAYARERVKELLDAD